MPYRLGWYQKHSVIYLDMIGTINAEEYAEAIERVLQERTQHPELIYMLADNRRLEAWPPLSALTRVQMPEDGTWVIVIGVSNSFFRFVTSAVSQVLGMQLKMVEDVPAARTTLERVAPGMAAADLPDSSESVEWFAASSPELLHTPEEAVTD
jgi:hypothetical protein